MAKECRQLRAGMAARAVGVTTKVMRRMHKDGTLPAARVTDAGSHYWDPSAVRAYLERQGADTAALDAMAKGPSGNAARGRKLPGSGAAVLDNAPGMADGAGAGKGGGRGDAPAYRTDVIPDPEPPAPSAAHNSQDNRAGTIYRGREWTEGELAEIDDPPELAAAHAGIDTEDQYPADDDLSYDIEDELLAGWTDLARMARRTLTSGADLGGAEMAQVARVLDLCEKSAVAKRMLVPRQEFVRLGDANLRAVLNALSPPTMQAAYGIPLGLGEELARRTYDSVLASIQTAQISEMFGNARGDDDDDRKRGILGD